VPVGVPPGRGHARLTPAIVRAPLLRWPFAMLAALPCSTVTCDVHAAIGFAIVAGWFVLFVFGLGAWILRREPGRPFWALLAVLQVLLAIQLIAGSVLLAAGHRADSFLHYLYGVAFPAIVLVVAHVLGRGMANEEDTWKVFAIAAFIVFGLTLRALTTGLGLP
jgi:hypothetical protein